MTRDDIIRWAREAAMVRKEGQWGVYYHEVGIPDLMRFAAFVAAAERDANLQQIDIIVEAEREACAQLVDKMYDKRVPANVYANTIRARGEG